MLKIVRSKAKRDELFAAASAEFESRPTLAVFGDLHWGDEATLDFLKVPQPAHRELREGPGEARCRVPAVVPADGGAATRRAGRGDAAGVRGLRRERRRALPSGAGQACSASTIGSRRMRRPTSRETAFANAGITGGSGGSPTPPSGSPESTNLASITGGASEIGSRR